MFINYIAKFGVAECVVMPILVRLGLSLVFVVSDLAWDLCLKI